MSNALSPFLKRVEAVLAQLSHDELKHRLLAHARELPASQREAYLELLASKPQQPKQTTDLLSAVETFVSDLESGVYYDGFGWDREYEGERAFGDESWAPTMDDLFAEAAKAFLAGDWPVASAAYGRLLGALDLEEAFSGVESPEFMLETDLGEARARYFRALYEAAAPAERPAILRDALDDLGPGAWANFDLGAMSDAHEAPLDGLEAFLPSWIALLEAMDFETHAARYRVRALVDATQQTEGAPGLARLARLHGDRHPLLYERWLDELMRADLREEALDAAIEGAERALEGFEAARLADRYADLAQAMNQPAAEERGRRLAWRKQPESTRFLKLEQSLRQGGSRAQDLAADELKAAENAEYPLPDALQPMLALLAGDLERLLVATAEASPLGWSYGESAGSKLLPFLLVGASGVERLPESPMLASLWHELTSQGLRSSAALRESADATHEPGLSWELLLMEAIAQKLSTPQSRLRALKVASEAAMRRIEAIVSGGHRKAYGRAAILAVAVGEAMSILGDRPGASAWLTRVRTSFPRHSAFKREIESAIKRSESTSDRGKRQDA